MPTSHTSEAAYAAEFMILHFREFAGHRGAFKMAFPSSRELLAFLDERKFVWKGKSGAELILTDRILEVRRVVDQTLAAKS